MKKLLGAILMCALITTPLLAAKTTTVNIPEAVTIGSTHVAAGEYRVSYDGAGPAVKVTLARSGSSPIVLDAKFAAGKKDTVSVTLGTVNGARVLQQIDLKSGSLVFGSPEAGN